MQDFVYARPQSMEALRRLLQAQPEARFVAGGQSLLAAMKLGLSAPAQLIDLQDLPELHGIAVQGKVLHIGAMQTHASIAQSPEVRAFCPMLAALAGGIADQQVRSVGTLGGALAHNDPAGCWPAGVLALGARLLTDQREIAADDFFQGLFGTALRPGELLLAVRFEPALAAAYYKQEQAASRFALLGVAVARLPAARGARQARVRVALTGLGPGVRRWAAAEQALAAQWDVTALDGLQLPATQALGDVHAGADYRAHLAGVLCRRLVARLSQQPAPAGTWHGLLQRFLRSRFRSSL